ncbi:unnamed protein product [Symbiodinium necroappetens]|uniref:Reverse transcriptase domain-containing protein n=1 Tax=Symbiodinium necroappetens TaxID=1628268 RepID=A0A812SEV4_9DINO|nr:unnamed protein product [Symbiodinium necroappetens]
MAALLAQPSASLGDLLRLFDLLPHEPAPAAGRALALAGGFSFGSGAWVHGNQVGLRNNTFSFPLSTRVFTRHVARHGPAHFQFSSIVVLDNVCTVAHRDSHNDPSSQNAVFGLSDFSGGEVWVQRDGGLTPFVANGKSLLGDALPTRPGPAIFAARHNLHATLPWSGRRVVLVAYTTTQLDRLLPDSKFFASGLGFVFTAQPAVPAQAPPPVLSSAPTLPAAVPGQASAVEIFSGTAVLSRALFAQGFSTFSVDHRPRAALMPTARLDLCDPAQQQLLLDRLCATLPSALHLAPPCGAASRAREKPLAASLKARGVREPQPLRSGLHPFGLPTLAEGSSDETRVRQANKLYAFCFKLVCWALDRSVAFTLENPAGSHFWAVFAALARADAKASWHKHTDLCFQVTFDHCMYGGTRPKSTRLLTNCPDMADLTARCDKGHSHAPWSACYSSSGWVFATHLEAAYPVCLAEAIASRFRAHAERNGAIFKPRPDMQQASLAVQGLQHRKAAALLSEFAYVPDVPRSQVDPAAMKVLTDATLQAIKTNLTTVEEQALHRSKPDWMQEILRGKRILLFRHLLQQHGYDDMEVVDLLSDGSHLVGASPKPACFEARLRLAKMTPECLREAAPDLRAAIVANPRKVSSDEAAALKQVTEEECRAGFLSGPFATEEEVTRHLGTSQWLAVRLQDSNYFAAMAMAIAKMEKDLGVSIPWVAKCLDLSKAYKQFCVSERDRSLSVIVIFDEAGVPTWYVANSLIFGAAASVFSFNRISRAIHFLFTRALNVVCSYFYDDYPLLARADTAEATDFACGKLLDLLGIKFARTGGDSKGKPFDKVFEVLGLSVSVAELHRGSLVLANKPGRLERLVELFGQVKSDGAITKHMGQVLVGLLRFAAGSCTGMSLKHVCADLNRMIHAEAFPSSTEFARLCDKALKFLGVSKPRVVCVSDRKDVVHVYTDGSLEDGLAGIGAVILDPSTGFQQVLQGQVPKALMHAWRLESGDHLICQIELFAVYCVKVLMPARLEGRRVIYWVDNEASRLALVKGQSKSPIMDRMLRALCDIEDGMHSYAWYSRVPSQSNIADSPSRGAGDEVAKALGLKTAEKFPETIPWQHLLRG